jgi:formate dehydrogenase gamma subunit
MTKNKPVIKTAKTKPVQKKRRVRRISHRDALEAAARLRRDARGKRYVIRFSLAERIEHIVLMISFTMLGITGLLQRYAGTAVGSLLLEITGGIEINRQLHHIFALIFFLETVYHFGVFLYRLFVYKRWGKIWPNYEDFLHFGQMMLLNLGLSKKHPQFGRFTFEEKVEYWALIWGVLLMGVTGVMQWFPAFITRWLPGSTIPVARALHSWEAVLAVLAILTWHLYHTVVKTVNKSIFTGIMTEAEMLEEHPAELKYLEQAAAALNRKTQLPPTKIEPIEDES